MAGPTVKLNSTTCCVPLGPPNKSMKKKIKKQSKDAFVHWYGSDIANALTVLVIGNPDSAVRELRKAKVGKTSEDIQILSDMLHQQISEYRSPHDPSARCNTGNTLWNDSSGVSTMWFPVVPSDATLVHESLHSVQNIMHATGINDDEFAAYTLANLFRHFQMALKEDLEKYEFSSNLTFINR